MIKYRKPWDQFFLDVANLFAKRSTCLTRQVGLVLVRNNRILATAYNGTPSGFTHCDKGGCLRCKDRIDGKLEAGEKYDSCCCVHAEQNMIAQCALHGVSPEGATVYCTHSPCSYCALLIVSSKIVRYFYCEDFDRKEGVSILKLANIEVFKRIDHATISNLT